MWRLIRPAVFPASTRRRFQSKAATGGGVSIGRRGALAFKAEPTLWGTGAGRTAQNEVES
ncbi:hypothetical protein THICB3590026 [Thiomonas sp. CB3]|nr:hypothetical protein THICB3590026 [Thiomonas sp. CB3]